MKIFVHDFAGHPFQFQLSREMARRGHKVTHAYFADLSGPKGNFGVAPSEAGSLTVEALRLNEAFDRYSYLQRLKAHYKYVTLLKDKVRQHQPEVVISGNMPTDAQYMFACSCIRQNIRFVHWVQDFYALALETLLRRKLGGLSRLAAAPFYMLERRIFRRSDAVVYISDDFSKYAASKGFSPRREKTIENWASLDELRPEAKTNSFSRAHSLHDKFVFLYAGTMGLKHSPHTLVDLARHFKDRPEIRIVLVSEGIGRLVLEEQKRKENLDNLVLLDFQPFEVLPQVFGAANVLLANVEPESSVFCVPSKILSYLCAARPILLSVPMENLGARVVERAQAGFTCRPGDVSGFLNCAELMWSNPEFCLKMGRNARQYAESMFNMARVGDLFENVLGEPTTNRAPVSNSVTSRVSP